MQIETPDIVVVGLGPAGSRAAAAAARAGAHVIAVERRSAAGRPVQCAEFVPALLEQDVRELPRVTQQAIGRMLTYVEDAEPDEMRDFPGHMIDRAAFDRLLAEQATAAGADCRFGSAALGIDADGAIALAGGGCLRPRVIIGADGPRSLVGAATGRRNRDLLETRQIAVPLHCPHDATDIFLSADYPGGYAWLFPKGRVANLGLGVVPEARQRLKPLLTRLHRRLVAEGRVGMAEMSLTGGAIPASGRLAATSAIGAVPALLAGDAAGLANPVTGAGIAAAVQSGDLAGDAASRWLGGKGTALDEYEEELGDIFDAAMARALERRRALIAGCRGGTRPEAAALRAGWIAFPQYWAA